MKTAIQNTAHELAEEIFGSTSSREAALDNLADEIIYTLNLDESAFDKVHSIISTMNF